MKNKNINQKMGDSRKTGNLTDKLGNLVEKMGHKISEAGAPGLGQKIHDLGDKWEKNHKNPNHPHKT